MRRLLIFLLLLGGCTIPPPPPALADQVDLLKSACLASCTGEQSVTLLLEGKLYATDEAVCIQQGRMLACGTCGCADSALIPAELAEATEPKNVTCAFRSSEEGITVSC